MLITLGMISADPSNSSKPSKLTCTEDSVGVDIVEENRTESGGMDCGENERVEAEGVRIALQLPW